MCANSERSNFVPLPSQLLPVLREGVEGCGHDGFVGRRDGSCLSVRMAEYIVQGVAEAAAVGIPVGSMSLRHAFETLLERTQTWIGPPGVSVGLSGQKSGRPIHYFQVRGCTQSRDFPA
jgi:hypothetical protein